MKVPVIGNALQAPEPAVPVAPAWAPLLCSGGALFEQMTGLLARIGHETRALRVSLHVDWQRRQPLFMAGNWLSASRAMGDQPDGSLSDAFVDRELFNAAVERAHGNSLVPLGLSAGASVSRRWLMCTRNDADTRAAVLIELAVSEPAEAASLVRSITRHGPELAMLTNVLHLFAEGTHAAVVEERQRMAREMHDGIVQAFIGIGMLLQHAPARPVDAIARARLMAAAGLEEARRSVRALRSELLDSRQLPEALERLGRSLVLPPTRFEMNTSTQIPALERDAEAQLFRIVQEAITNAVKHAGARCITVDLACTSREMSILVIDDGCGFDLDGVDDYDGYGLQSMQQRAASIGARLELVSSLGNGTQILVTFWLATAFSDSIAHGALDTQQGGRLSEIAAQASRSRSQVPWRSIVWCAGQGSADRRLSAIVTAASCPETSPACRAPECIGGLIHGQSYGLP